MLNNRNGLKGKDLISIHDLTATEVRTILDTAKELKAWQKAGLPHPILRSKTLAEIFHKPSLRTRVSFEVAMTQLGGHGLHLTDDELGFGKRESVADIARVLCRMVDGIMIRTFSHEAVRELAEYSSVPVINGLDDLVHPCQAFADIMTAEEKIGCLQGVKMAYVGDGNNVAHSLMHIAAKVGMNITIACPEGYDPLPEMVSEATADAKATGAVISIVRDPREAVQGADILYTDVWTSMGQEKEKETRLSVFKPYQVNGELIRMARPNILVMHCLPAHRGEEITDEVMDGPNSVVFDQAENRLHAQKGVLACLL
jgi:ornithine carbamoyltransferase